ncbi:MAG: alpha/beta hydrolase [Thermoanaerobaculia bacterium]|nr:alpha/beta hydrolase [Thermoanaerobaculia bacterium]
MSDTPAPAPSPHPTSQKRSAFDRLRRTAAALLLLTLGVAIGLVAAQIWSWNQFQLEPWHEELLDPPRSVGSFAEYRTQEEELFASAAEALARRVDRWPAFSRFDPASPSYTADRATNWNQSQVLTARDEHGLESDPVAGVLLLHGLSDSPYSLRAVGELLNRRGFEVVAPRMPGHGLHPGALAEVSWEEWRHVADLAHQDLRQRIGDGKPILIVGYSNGAALALDLVLRSLEDPDVPLAADRMVLLSPALAVTPSAKFAPALLALSRVPGFRSVAWNSVVPEYDPYKYNSFPVRSGYEIYGLIGAVERGLRRLEKEDRLGELPPILTVQSVVDATVPAVESLTRLYRRIFDPDSQLVLFDANRHASVVDFLGPRTDDLLALADSGTTFPFRVTLVTNIGSATDRVQAVTRFPGSQDERHEPLDLFWPSEVFSLSHVAIPFPPDDPVYGIGEPGGFGIGSLAPRGEKSVLLIPPSLLVRLRYNPFFPYLERRLLEFVEPLSAAAGTGP